MRASSAALLVTVFATVAMLGGCSSGMDPAVAEELQQQRNLGKAFYENPGSSEEAVEALRKALALNPESAREHLNYGLALLRAGNLEEGLAEVEKAKEIDPTLPHPYFNLGIEYKQQGEAERAAAELEKMAELVPGEAKTHYNLGQLYKQLERNEEAIAKFELAAELDPSLAAPHFQLYNMFRRADRERARREMDEFRRIKAAQDTIDASEDINWSFYSELYDPAEPGPGAERAASLRFESETLALRTIEAEPLATLDAEGNAGLLVLDIDADKKPDLLAWSSTLVGLWNARGSGLATSDELPLGRRAWGARGVSAGDWDNDGFPEICIANADSVVLAENAEGWFAGGSLQALGDYESCLFFDYDHDLDPDLFALGAESRLFVNASGEDELTPGEFPFVPGKRALAAIAAEFFEDNSVDLVVAYEDSVIVYKDRKLGRFEPSDPIKGVVPGPAPIELQVVDVDQNGFYDVVLRAADGSTRLLRNDEGTLHAGPQLPRTLAFADFENRGWADVVRPDGVGVNNGEFDFDDASAEGLPASLVAAAAADFDGDGLIDLAVLDENRAVHLATNATETSNSWTSIGLSGVKSPKLPKGARVEVKAGRIYRKQLYQGAPLHFGLGGAEQIDTVRITWPNGLIQNEFRQAINEAFAWDEKPRLSGSCPMIYTWNGKEFEYISEVLGVAPLGASLGDGQFFAVDHDEHVFIRGDQLAARDGFYEIRLTEELREVAYVDLVELLVVDHPADVEIFSNEKFKAPPFPEFKLFGVHQHEKLRPVTAVDHRGVDVRERLLAADRRDIDSFERTYRNVAEPHSLTLDFPALAGKSEARLFLNGWADWSDASTIVAGSQTRSQKIAPPVLQVRDAAGEWRTVIEDLGLPGGRRRTMSVDLTGKFLSESREIRILTNMCLYWDEIFAVAGSAENPEHALRRVSPSEAQLRFRGFSENVVHSERTQPEEFIYASVQPASAWNPTHGEYTAFGPVNELLADIDDRLAIFGAGDEIALRFPAVNEPPPHGWKRDYLLLVDGWAKENEANTAFGDSVEPLPFHSMSSYPYGSQESFPSTPEHLEYLRNYNTRPALRLIRPLRP